MGVNQTSKLDSPWKISNFSWRAGVSSPVVSGVWRAETLQLVERLRTLQVNSPTKKFCRIYLPLYYQCIT